MKFWLRAHRHIYFGYQKVIARIQCNKVKCNLSGVFSWNSSLNHVRCSIYAYLLIQCVQWCFVQIFNNSKYYVATKILYSELSRAHIFLLAEFFRLGSCASFVMWLNSSTDPNRNIITLILLVFVDINSRSLLCYKLD